jgi:CheY-like chemotaxis protein
LTANAFKEDVEMALANGMNAHLAKPVEMDRVIETLHIYLGPQTAGVILPDDGRNP